ncbi:AAA family ATPase [Caulobacter sp. B11]|uniref:zeta toxin family protein n=1 Tax=Caulobacter sp. B11 TaxID=2048899 RepID=UPI0021017E22|nr:AAA family ATPase [Caulobacter sp. B11]
MPERALPTILLVAGPNGAGKTTFATRWINDSAPNYVFANADEIARRLTEPTLSSTERDMRAGRLMLAQLDAHVARGADIVLETTLSSRLYARRIMQWRASGYSVVLVYVGLPNVEASISRVAHRVRMGGHDVAEGDLRRRFERSRANLEIYKALVDRWEVWESREGTTSFVARSSS